MQGTRHKLERKKDPWGGLQATLERAQDFAKDPKYLAWFHLIFWENASYAISVLILFRAYRQMISLSTCSV